MSPDDLRLHLAYSGWASGKLLQSVLALNEEDQRRDVGCSHKSLLGTLEHVFRGDRIWFVRTVDPRAEEIEGPLDIAWPKLQKRWEGWASGLSHQDILRSIEYKAMNGDPHRTPIWQVVMHVVNHATLHRGQVMAMLRQLNVQPPQTDLITYYREFKVK
jgi:uncharacterized damage-inducible protein DinB